MKIFLSFILLSFSFSTFATDRSAVDALLEVIKVGKYSGTNSFGKCTVELSEVNFPEKAINVSVEDDNYEITKLVQENDVYRYRGYNNEFVQSTISYLDESKDNYIEQSVRTLNTSKGKLYVGTAYTTVFERETLTKNVECIISIYK
jgi:hypothetical protein